MRHDLFLRLLDRHQFQDEATAQAVLSIVSLHYVAEKAHADRSTLIHFAGRNVIADLTEMEQTRLFDFVELLAFSGLSKRQYFQMGKDTVTVIISGYRFLNAARRTLVFRSVRGDEMDLSIS